MDNTSERLYTVTEACKVLGISDQTLRRADNAGRIRCVRTPGGRRRVPESEITRILESGPIEAQPEPAYHATGSLSPEKIEEIRYLFSTRLRIYDLKISNPAGKIVVEVTYPSDYTAINTEAKRAYLAGEMWRHCDIRLPVEVRQRGNR